MEAKSLFQNTYVWIWITYTFCFWTLASVSEHCWRWRIRPKHLKCSVWLFSYPCAMFQNTNVLFLYPFNAILNIMDANACVLSVEFIYSVCIYWCITYTLKSRVVTAMQQSDLLLMYVSIYHIWWWSNLLLIWYMYIWYIRQNITKWLAPNV